MAYVWQGGIEGCRTLLELYNTMEERRLDHRYPQRRGIKITLLSNFELLMLMLRTEVHFVVLVLDTEDVNCHVIKPIDVSAAERHHADRLQHATSPLNCSYTDLP
jgi:hypothetical protein